MKKIAIVEGCTYTSQGLKSLLSCLFQSQFIFYQHLHDVPEKNNEMLVIAVIDECNINYADITWMKRRAEASDRQNMLILCDGILQNILASVFNINCLYVSHNAALNDVKNALSTLLFKEENQRKKHFSSAKLTTIESRILMMLAEGLSVTEISEIRRKNVKTISSHKAKLMRKMGMPNTLKTLSMISLYLKSISATDIK